MSSAVNEQSEDNSRRLSEDSFLEALNGVDSAKRAFLPAMAEMEPSDYSKLDDSFKSLKTLIEFYRKKYFPTDQL